MKPSEIRAMRVKTDVNQVRVVVGGRASFAFLMEPQIDDEDFPDRKSYKSGILVPNAAPAEVFHILDQAIEDAIKLGMKKKWGGRRPAGLKLPKRDGNEKYEESPDRYEAYKDVTTFTAKKKESFGRPVLMAGGVQVTKSGVIESGDWCAFDISFYPFSGKSKGVAIALNGVTLIKTGERFGGGPSTQSIADEAGALYSGMDFATVGADEGLDGVDELDELDEL